MSTVWDADGQAARALQAAVADFGPQVLGSAEILGNLLKDLLPDRPREAGLLIAAAQCGIADSLTRRIGSEGMDPATAMRLAVADIQARNAVDGDAALWAVAALGQVLGHATVVPSAATPAASGAGLAGGGAAATGQAGVPVTAPAGAMPGTGPNGAGAVGAGAPGDLPSRAPGTYYPASGVPQQQPFAGPVPAMTATAQGNAGAPGAGWGYPASADAPGNANAAPPGAGWASPMAAAPAHAGTSGAGWVTPTAGAPSANTGMPGVSWPAPPASAAPGFGPAFKDQLTYAGTAKRKLWTSALLPLFVGVPVLIVAPQHPILLALGASFLGAVNGAGEGLAARTDSVAARARGVASRAFAVSRAAFLLALTIAQVIVAVVIGSARTGDIDLAYADFVWRNEFGSIVVAAVAGCSAMAVSLLVSTALPRVQDVAALLCALLFPLTLALLRYAYPDRSAGPWLAGWLISTVVCLPFATARLTALDRAPS